MSRPPWKLLALVALLGVLAVGLVQASGADDPPPGVTTGRGAAPPEEPDLLDRGELAAQAERRLAGAPPELAALHAEANELLPGGPAAFTARLRELRGAGRPVVVNLWASWCGPCAFEFAFFQRQALARGREVAFLGVDVEDADAAARAFLRERPVPFPSYTDPERELADDLRVLGLPTTVFVDGRGERYVHQGVYRSEADLARDIERYALAR